MGSLQANEVAEKAAVAASGAWLSLVDRGDYAESWNQAAGLALKIPNIQGYAQSPIELFRFLWRKRSDKVAQKRLRQTYKLIAVNTAIVLQSLIHTNQYLSGKTVMN